MSDLLGEISSKRRIWAEIVWIVGALLLFFYFPASIILFIIAVAIS